jgi:hypothetical protein
VSDWEGPLDDLRWHWGDAYLIHCFGLGTWVAQRRDSHATMGAKGPDELRDKIAADYRAHPVSRRTAGSGRPETPGCRFRPEG